VVVETEADQYRSTLEQMAALRGGTSSPPEWNRLFRANHSSYLVLRESIDGRSAIEALLSHDSATVRSVAAAHVLLWNETAARPVLDALLTGDDVTAVDAKYTLREYDRGRLTHDW
jgi:hypothetical protein